MELKLLEAENDIINGTRSDLSELREEVEALRSELGKYQGMLSNYFAPENLADATLSELIHKSRQIMAAFDADFHCKQQQEYQLNQEHEYLSREITKHEASLGIETIKPDPTNPRATLISRVRHALACYQKDTISTHKLILETVEDLETITAAKERLTAGYWAGTPYGIIQIFILKICSLRAARLRQSIRSYPKTDNFEF